MFVHCLYLQTHTSYSGNLEASTSVESIPGNNSESLQNPRRPFYIFIWPWEKELLWKYHSAGLFELSPLSNFKKALKRDCADKGQTLILKQPLYSDGFETNTWSNWKYV